MFKVKEYNSCLKCKYFHSRLRKFKDFNNTSMKVEYHFIPDLLCVKTGEFVSSSKVVNTDCKYFNDGHFIDEIKGV